MKNPDMQRIFLCLIFGSFILLISNCKKEDENPMESPTPSIKTQGTTLNEGDAGTVTAKLQVSLSERTDREVSVQYQTVDASALSWLDYLKQEGTLVFPPGDSTTTIEITIISDEHREANEYFTLILFNPQNATINNNNIKVNITNDDSQVPMATDGYLTPTEYEGWNAVWADEFEGQALDPATWNYEIGNGDGGWGNNELEFYTDRQENVRLVDGQLIIEARNDNWNGNPYTSARITTQEKQSFGLSRVDIRARIPYGQGIWPALWMLGDDITEVGWPLCGEIDIMELVGHQPTIVHGTVHFGPESPNNQMFGTSFSISEQFSERFHVFSIVRDQDRIFFYVDDIFYLEVTPANMNGAAYPFNNTFFFIFNVAVGGNWPGPPNQSTEFPQQMVVDYVRVFERK